MSLKKSSDLLRLSGTLKQEKRTPQGNLREAPSEATVGTPVPNKKKNRKGKRQPRAREEEEDEQIQETLTSLELEDGPVAFQAVLKVFTTLQEPDFENPWQMGTVQQATGSAVVIAGKRILTAAHVVADATFLQVQRTDVKDPELRPARIYAVAHECDLALLELETDDPSFWSGIVPVEFGALPSLRSRVFVAGFPVGGDELSITDGVVSRIEGQPYEHSQRQLLAVTVDAAINAGNSGGPVFNEEGRLIGIAFQALVGAENTGHIIPAPVMLHFVEGVKRLGPANYLGFPSLGVETQHLLNPLLRAHLGLEKDQSGVFVTDVIWGNSSFGLLQKGDVIMQIAGQKVANNGTTAHGRYRVDFLIETSLHQCGESLKVTVMRNKQVQELSVVLKPQFDLVPLAQHDVLPPYFVYCGLVFQVLSLDYLTNMFQAGAIAAPKSLLALFESSNPSEDRFEVVLLSHVLTHAVNLGYDELLNQVITYVQGKKVSSLHHLAHEIETSTADSIEIRTSENILVLIPGPRNPAAHEANEKITARYRVTADRSLDLRTPYNPAQANSNTIALEQKRRCALRHRDQLPTLLPPPSPVASPKPASVLPSQAPISPGGEVFPLVTQAAYH